MSDARIAPRRSWVDVMGVASTSSSTEVRVRARGDWLRRSLAKLTRHLWKYTQVDYEGSYSLEKTLCLLHCRQSAATKATLLLLSPWLSLALALLSELLPLEDPRLGWRRCPNFHLRLLFRTTLFSAGNAVVSQEAIPSLYLSPLTMLVMCVVLALAFQASVMLFAEMFDVFPVPFSLFAGTPLYVVAFWLSRANFLRTVVFNNPDREVAARIKKRFLEFVNMTNKGPVTLVVYAAFGTAFYQVGSRLQLLLALLLQVLKVAVKYHMWSESYFTSAGDDLASERVISSTHFFHALFTVTSLQDSKSPLTLLLLVGWNATFDVYAMHKLYVKSQLVDARWQSIPPEERHKGRVHIVEKTIRNCSGKSDPGFPVRSSYERIHLHAQSFLPANQLAPVDAASNSELAWLRETTQFFHWRESVLLRLFVDIFVPCFYLIFVSALTRLPNQQYFPILFDLKMAVLVQRVLVHVLCKCMVLTAFLVIQKRQMRKRRQKDDDPQSEPSELQHLCFVLYAHRYSFQATLLVVGLTVLDFPLAHLGNDLTFQFRWIRERQSAT